MGKHDLDKQFAALCLIVKAMRSENLITQETYEIYLSRYSKTVSSMSSVHEAKPMTLEQLNAQQKIDEQTRYFEAILRDQWDLHISPVWRTKVLENAEKWKDQIPAANALLEKFRDKVLGR